MSTYALPVFNSVPENLREQRGDLDVVHMQ